MYRVANSSLRPQAGRRRAGRENIGLRAAALARWPNTGRGIRCTADLVATLGRIRSPQPLSDEDRLAGAVRLHPGTYSTNLRRRASHPPLLSAQLAVRVVQLSATAGSVLPAKVINVLGIHVPPTGTLCRFRTPQPPPMTGGLAGAVHLHTGPAGGAASAPPLARRLKVGNRLRLGLRQHRPGGRLAAPLQLPADSSFTSNVVRLPGALLPSCQSRQHSAARSFQPLPTRHGRGSAVARVDADVEVNLRPPGGYTNLLSDTAALSPCHGHASRAAATGYCTHPLACWRFIAV